MKKTLVYVLLISVVLLSGCVGTGEKAGLATGIIIKEFSSDFVEYTSGEPVVVYLTLQNIGESDAKNVKVKLFQLNPAEWGSASFPEKELPILRRAVPVANIPGEEAIVEWELTAPHIKTSKEEFIASCGISYEYETNATATLRFVTNDYLRSLKSTEQEKIRKSSGLVKYTSSNAPIKVSFSTQDRPFVVYKPGDKFSFQIIITNVGQGNVFDKEADNGEMTARSRYKLRINKPDIAGEKVDIDCPTLGSATGGYYQVELRKGESKILSCTATVKDIVNIMDGNIFVNLKYGYYIDSSTTIKVIQV